jgi:hypothetical protein
MLPLHECVAESVADPTIVEFVAGPATTQSTVELFHSVADPATAGAAPTETSCLCVQV